MFDLKLTLKSFLTSPSQLRAGFRSTDLPVRQLDRLGRECQYQKLNRLKRLQNASKHAHSSSSSRLGMSKKIRVCVQVSMSNRADSLYPSRIANQSRPLPVCMASGTRKKQRQTKQTSASLPSPPGLGLKAMAFSRKSSRDRHHCQLKLATLYRYLLKSAPDLLKPCHQWLCTPKKSILSPVLDRLQPLFREGSELLLCLQ